MDNKTVFTSQQLKMINCYQCKWDNKKFVSFDDLLSVMKTDCLLYYPEHIAIAMTAAVRF